MNNVRRRFAAGCLRLTLRLACLLAASPGIAGAGSESQASPSFLKVPEPATVEAVNKSASIDGLKGGKLSLGRFTITVPAGAYRGAATVTLFVPDRKQLCCALGISPPSLNAFLKPVEMRVDFKNSNATDASQIDVMRFDPKLGLWVPVSGTAVQFEESATTTPLWHFSLYGVVQGKAGW